MHCFFRKLIEKGCFHHHLLTLPMRTKNGFMPEAWQTPLISKKQFNKIRHLFPARKQRKRLDDRKVISAILLVIRYGLPWRYIPDFYGKWSSIYSRFIRWSRAGIIQKIFYALAHKLPKRCKAMIDSAFCKAQRSACCIRSDGNRESWAEAGVELQ